jgi:hypothetical protein
VTRLGEFSPIGRLFSYWAIVLIGQVFENYRRSPNFGATFFSYVSIITTNGLGYTLGYFFLPHLVTLKLTSGQKKSFSGQSGGDPHGGRARTVQVVRSFLPKTVTAAGQLCAKPTLHM